MSSFTAAHYSRTQLGDNCVCVHMCSNTSRVSGCLAHCVWSKTCGVCAIMCGQGIPSIIACRNLMSNVDNSYINCLSMFVCLSVCPCWSVCLRSTWLPVYLSINLSVLFYLCLSICLSSCPPLSVMLSTAHRKHFKRLTSSIHKLSCLPISIYLSAIHWKHSKN